MGQKDESDLPWCRDSPDRKSTRLNSSHLGISYAVFCLKKKKKKKKHNKEQEKKKTKSDNTNKKNHKDRKSKHNNVSDETKSTTHRALEDANQRPRMSAT